MRFFGKFAAVAAVSVALWFLMSNMALFLFGAVVEGEVTAVRYARGAGATSTTVYYKFSSGGKTFYGDGYFSTMFWFVKGQKIDVIVLKTRPSVHYLDYRGCLFFFYCLPPLAFVILCAWLYLCPPGRSNARGSRALADGDSS